MKTAFKCIGIIVDEYGRTIGFKLINTVNKEIILSEQELINEVKDKQVELMDIIFNEKYNNFSFNRNKLEIIKQTQENKLVMGYNDQTHNQERRFETYGSELSAQKRIKDIEYTQMLREEYDGNEDLKILLDKAKLLGLEHRKIKIYDNKEIWYVKITDDLHKIYIPSDIKYIHYPKPTYRFGWSWADDTYKRMMEEEEKKANKPDEFDALITSITGTVQFFGGGKLEETWRLFRGCETDAIIDLSNLNLNSVTYYASMFEDCKLSKIIFGDIQSEYTCDMRSMFSNADIGEIHMEKVKGLKIEGFDNMFSFCKSSLLRIDNLDLSEIIHEYEKEEGETLNKSKIHFMFSHCEIGKIITNCPYIKEAYSWRKGLNPRIYNID